ncbi:MAG: hydantoinase/oxoprolinase family protein [Alphaproteobacteria bacterium]|nr:hydantoinase/oxoprolinase family protein [Alphaproteobacteria bacterium]
MSENAGMRFAVAVDTGGTFTDVTLFDRDRGQMWTAKTPSTPDDPSRGFMNGIEAALQQASLSPSDLSQVFHGTTVATNLILEGKGDKVGLLTTAGFKHVLEIGRQDIPRRVNLFAWIKPTRPVPPERILEIPERLDAQGGVLTELNEDAVRDAARTLRDRGVNAIAVCFLNSFVDPKHELRAGELVREEHPDALLSLSSDVLRVFREYERSIATVLNVYVMPAVSRYVAQLAERLAEADAVAPLLIMKSNGGVVGAGEVERVPAHTALSGPAAGVVGARFIGEAAGFKDVIGIDIGGTSADICLIKDGNYDLTNNGRIGEWPLSFPMLDINTVGTGGGSIARVSDTGALTVGPASAGANPGPACYGNGGEEPTVTDAHLVLGHLPSYLLGGTMQLDVEAARAAVERQVAQPLGLGVEEAARGILSISDNDMVGAIRVISVERGHDPRDFALIAFGGAGPLHGGSLARLLGARTVIIPPHPGVLSAMGLLVSQFRADYARTCLEVPPEYDHARMATTFDELEAEATQWFERERVPNAARTLTRHVSLRYRHQGFELNVPWAGNAVTPETTDKTLDAFHALHEQLYTFAQRDTPVEIVTLHVTAEGSLPQPRLTERPSGGTLEEARVDQQTIHFEGGTQSVPVYDRDKLSAGISFPGPALVVQLDSTALIHPDQHVTCDRFGNLIAETR